MSTYQIIGNETALRDYIDNFLPEMKENEQVYCALLARKKYIRSLPYIKSDKAQLKRFTSKKEFLFDKIAQLECKLGAYKIEGQPVPQEALALYITPNPRDLWKATIKGIQQLAKVVECNGRNSNPHQEVMSEIQKSSSERTYVIFDLDDKCPDKLNECLRIVDNKARVVETRGGYHIFLRKEHCDTITNKKWYVDLKKHCDQMGDIMSPPVGTIQGGHLVRFYE